MSSTGEAEAPADSAPDAGNAGEPGEPHEPGTAEDQAYFRALEEHLLQLRGKTTLLAPADWQTAVEWRRRGIPIDLVRSVMSELVARQRAKSTKRTVSSLRYFRAAVDAAWDDQLALGAGAVAPGFDPGPPLEERLRRLADAIPLGLAGSDAIRAEILALGGGMEEVEAELVALDRRLMAAAEARLPPDERARLDLRVEQATRSFVAGLPEGELALLGGRLRAQALREADRLPLLSLFSAAALAPADPPLDE